MSLKSFLWVCAATFGLTVAAPLAQAQNADASAAPKNAGVFMAVLDTEGVSANSKAMKNIHEQFAKYQAEMQSSIDKEKLGLQKEEEELNRKRSLLAPEVFAEERKKFQSRVVAFQRKAQESSLKLNQVRAQATEKFSDALRGVIKDIVEGNGITILFHKKLTVVSDPAMDISGLVLAELDKRLPSVQVANPMK